MFIILSFIFSHFTLCPLVLSLCVHSLTASRNLHSSFMCSLLGQFPQGYVFHMFHSCFCSLGFQCVHVYHCAFTRRSPFVRYVFTCVSLFYYSIICFSIFTQCSRCVHYLFTRPFSCCSLFYQYWFILVSLVLHSSFVLPSMLTLCVNCVFTL